MGQLRWVSTALVVFGVSVWFLSGLAEPSSLVGNEPTKNGNARVKGVKVVDPGVNAPAPNGPGQVAAGPKGGLPNVTKVHSEVKAKLIKTKGIIGFGIMADPAKKGSYAFRVYTTGRVPPVVPAEIEGVPTYSRYMPRGFRPLQSTLPIQQQRLPRPVPIGTSVSILIEDSVDTLAPFGECYSGTLGCRVRDRDNNVYGLSNNHVLALTDRTKEGARVIQPSSGDTFCQSANTGNTIGTFHKFVPFDGNGFNYQDSAIMKTTSDMVSNATPLVGYGIPKRVVAQPFIGQRVQKMGRTTGFTNRASVTGINEIVLVGPYDGGFFYLFDNQVEITTDTGAPVFGAPGDSGSLIVDSSNSPVALLFAGLANVTFGSPILPILRTYNLTIDGDTDYDPVRQPPGKNGKFKPGKP